MRTKSANAMTSPTLLPLLARREWQRQRARRNARIDTAWAGPVSTRRWRSRGASPSSRGVPGRPSPSSPMSVDLRTRMDGPQPPVDPGDFFGRELPERLDVQAAAIRAGARWLALTPLTVETGGEAWTLRWADGRVEIRCGGGGGGAPIRLAAGQLDDLVHDQQTPTGWRSSGRLDQPAGTITEVLDWWLVLRAALDGRALHVPGAVTFRDRAGGPLDLHRTFRA